MRPRSAEPPEHRARFPKRDTALRNRRAELDDAYSTGLEPPMRSEEYG